jgi:hypothetical protein
MESFRTQSNALAHQQDALMKQLDELTQHYVNTQALMQRIVTRLNALKRLGRQRQKPDIWRGEVEASMSARPIRFGGK